MSPAEKIGWTLTFLWFIVALIAVTYGLLLATDRFVAWLDK